MLDTDSSTKRGQAIIEFCIGLVAVLIVATTMIQFGRIGIAKTNVRTEATARASQLSMEPPSDSFDLIYPYILSVEDGEDERSYSVDDVRNQTNAAEAYNRILHENDSSFLRTAAPDNPMAWIRSPEDMQASTGFVQAQSSEQGIPVMPIARRLLWNRNRVGVDAEVWSVETGGFY